MTKETAMKILKELHDKSLFAERTAIETIIPELKKSEDDKIRKELIEALKRYNKRHVSNNNRHPHFEGIEVDKALTWLEKQGEHQQLYIRFGDIPSNEKSKIYRGEKEIGIENGVSVYPAFKSTNGDIVLGLNLPITKTTLHTQQHLLEYDNRPCYLVTGDYVGKDTDGQILISNVNIIEKIDNYRVKTEKQDDTTSNARYEVKADSLSVNGKPFDYEKATITQKDYAHRDYNEIDPNLGIPDWVLMSRKNPVDKVEPKFKVGDWVVNNNSGDVYQVTEIRDDEYCLWLLYSEIQGYLRIIDVDTDYHLWTIQDAKKGDVLHSIGFHNDCIFIFNGLDNDGYREVATGYCCLFVSADKMEFGIQGPDGIEIGTVKPATKIQRDLLFQKMKEARYTFDFEKKELKKVEDEIEIPFGAKDSELQEETYFIPKGFHAEIDDDKVVIKKGEKKPAWSDEDEEMYKIAFSCIETLEDISNGKNMHADVKEWLKSLKDRIGG